MDNEKKIREVADKRPGVYVDKKAKVVGVPHGWWVEAKVWVPRYEVEEAASTPTPTSTPDATGDET